jgi:hypothetical protein
LLWGEDGEGEGFGNGMGVTVVRHFAETPWLSGGWGTAVQLPCWQE